MQVLTKFSFGMKNVDSFLVKLMMKIVIQKVMLIRKYVKICTSHFFFVIMHIAYEWEHLCCQFIVYENFFAFIYYEKAHSGNLCI